MTLAKTKVSNRFTPMISWVATKEERCLAVSTRVLVILTHNLANQFLTMEKLVK